jgi:hypothetical protein
MWHLKERERKREREKKERGINVKQSLDTTKRNNK